MNIAQYALYIFLIAQPTLLFAVEIARDNLFDYKALYKTSTKAQNDISLCSLLMFLQENSTPTKMDKTQKLVRFLARPEQVEKTNNIMKIYAITARLHESNQ